MTRTPQVTETEYRITVWMRDDSPQLWDRRPPIDERLRDLVAAGVIEDFTIHVWGKQILADATTREPQTADGTSIRKAVSRFESWAAAHDESLEPGFRTRERGSMLTDETTSVIVLPVICLAVYEGDQLIAVFPCSKNGETKTVEQCLDRLEAMGSLSFAKTSDRGLDPAVD